MARTAWLVHCDDMVLPISMLEHAGDPVGISSNLGPATAFLAAVPGNAGGREPDLKAFFGSSCRGYSTKGSTQGRAVPSQSRFHRQVKMQGHTGCCHQQQDQGNRLQSGRDLNCGISRIVFSVLVCCNSAPVLSDCSWVLGSELRHPLPWFQ